jgi:hypothetical protein
VTGEVPERGGVRHLAVLARAPRPAGSAAEHDARAYASSVLAALGYDVHEERFQYSAFPGCYATPIAGAVLGATIVAASLLALRANANVAAIVLVAGVVVTALFAKWMLGDGVLTVPWMRREGVNLVATRGAAQPQVWLVAHIDSKSQPVPSAVRVAGVVTLAVALVLACLALVLTLVDVPSRTVWWVALAAGAVGALPVVASVVGSRSDGAVDNASGVATVLGAAAQMRPDAGCGVLLPSAEELGLAGARAWARTRAAGVALNCDGVDDDGALVIMYNQSAPNDVVDAVRAATPVRVSVRMMRMPLGLLTDSTALADAGWRTVTVSHGSLATLRRIHTPNDSLATLRGTRINDVADILARAAEALAT